MHTDINPVKSLYPNNHNTVLLEINPSKNHQKPIFNFNSISVFLYHQQWNI